MDIHDECDPGDGENIDEFNTLADMRAFMRLPASEKREILRKQAEEMASYYEENKEEIDELQGGDIIEYE